MNARRGVHVERHRLRFAAAHMATFGGRCEPLHGHNYDVIIEAEGQLTDESWVIDFGDLKRLGREVCSRLDHRFLLQRDSRTLHSVEDAGAWRLVTSENRQYVMPAGDVVALPIDNSTSERLAEWYHGQLAEALARLGVTGIQVLRVGIEEMPGQSAWYEASPARR